jgi:hypothetical protein
MYYVATGLDLRWSHKDSALHVPHSPIESGNVGHKGLNKETKRTEYERLLIY